MIDIIGSVKNWMLETVNDETSPAEVKSFAHETLSMIETLENEEVQKLLDFFTPKVKA